MNSHHKRTPLKAESQYHTAPAEVVGLSAALPDDVSLGASYTDWGRAYDRKDEPVASVVCLCDELFGALTPELRAKLEAAAEVERAADLTRKVQIAQVVAYMMALPPDEFRHWAQEQQKKMDAFDLYAKGGE